MFENDYTDDLLQEFADNLKRKIPGDDWFLNAFRNIGWSNHHDLYKGEKNKNRVQLIVEVIEKFVSQSHQTHPFTLEHMLPDSEGIANAQIGNLIPLEESLNRRCAAKTLEEKYDIYGESGFTSARNVAKRNKGKTFDPAKRTEFLAKLMYNNILELNQFDFSKS